MRLDLAHTRLVIFIFHICSLSSQTNRVNLLFHLLIMQMMSNTISSRTSHIHILISAFKSNDLSLRYGAYNPPFNNPSFIKSFVQSFLSIVRFANPNIKYDSENITPPWAPWSSGHTEMLFNKTETNQTDIRTFATDANLLERCS